MEQRAAEAEAERQRNLAAGGTHGGSISCKPTLGMRIGAAGSKRATRTFASVGDEAVPGLVQEHTDREEKLEEEAFEAEQAAFEAEEAAEAEATTDQPRFVPP